jgi:hypothetical protein
MGNPPDRASQATEFMDDCPPLGPGFPGEASRSDDEALKTLCSYPPETAIIMTKSKDLRSINCKVNIGRPPEKLEAKYGRFCR